MSDCSVLVLDGFSHVSKETRGWKTLLEDELALVGRFA